MKASSNHNFSAKDLERYHKGEMSPAERHALEKAAMDDPFLADALEGYAFTSAPAQDLETIRNRLFPDRDKKKPVPFIQRKGSWLRIAAILILIAAGSWLALQLNFSQKQDLALGNNPSKNEIARQDTNLNSSPAKDSPVITKTGKKEEAVALDIKNNIAVTEESKDKHSSFSGNVSASNQDIAVNQPPSAIKVEEGIQLPDPMQRRLGNRITNLNDTGFIDITASKKTKAAEHDDLYRKDSPSSSPVIAQQPTAKSPRFQTDSINNLHVVLQPDNRGLSEVVVLGQGKRDSSRTRYMQVKVDTLEPAVGWAKFDEYVANNIQRPEDITTKEPMKGSVELIFDVNSKGKPVNITVSRSLCPSCDEEAIRILRDGPRWKKKKNKKGIVTIRF